MKKPKQIIPPVYYLVALVAMLILNFVFPVKRLIHFPFNWLGLVFVVIGNIFNKSSLDYFKKVDTPESPYEKSTYLVTAGLYRFTRNPMYLGGILIILGIAVILGSLSPFFVLPFLIWAVQRSFVRREESALEEIFGEEYRAYKKKVRRWI